ncbi:MAG: alpha-amylase [Anaerolineales bacterium]|nr:alpha-amylase [Anaerolineales bacterium]
MKLSKSADLPWWQRAVIYQIYPRSFKDTTGNGIGDLEGILNKLDYLNDGSSAYPNGGIPPSLGIDVIWISPFYPSPMADFGYDVANYVDVDPLFGNLQTLDRLIEEIHKRGMKIIIDYVPNHTSDQHPWFIESRSSKKNSKRDWYIWRDPKPGGSPPNNWGSVFGGPAWTLDKNTGQYYLHQFLREQPELNWREREVKEAMLDVLRFWLERGVDGFRMDVVGMILKDVELKDNPPSSRTDPNLPSNDIFGRQMHLYNEDQDEVHQVIREFRKLLDQYDDRCAIGEVWYEMPRWIKYYGESGDGLHLPFNFRLMHLPWEAEAFRHSVDGLEGAIPSFGWPNYVLGNHDGTRLASRIGTAQARVAAMLLLTLRGTPTLYYGDELGIENGVITQDLMQDPQGFRLGLHKTRDFCRTPMQWNSEPYAGFSKVEPWLPVEANYQERNIEVQSDDPSSMLNLYRQLLWYRCNTPALVHGTYRPLNVDHDCCYLYLREHSEGSRLVALNFVDQSHTISIPDGGRGEVVMSTYLDRAERVSLSNLLLRSNEGIIIEVNS